MNLKDARSLIKDEHVRDAARRIDEHGVDWLYARTGRRAPDFRYIVVGKTRYPAKAFGFLTAQLAGGTDRKSNDMTVNEAVAPITRLGYIEVTGRHANADPEQDRARRESYYSSLARPGQAAFRRSLLRAYDQRCAVTGCTALDALEAAHVQPFKSRGCDQLSNGVLLRADLHRLFDAGRIAVDPHSLTVKVGLEIRPDYASIDDAAIATPKGGPSPDQFRPRWRAFTR